MTDSDTDTDTDTDSDSEIRDQSPRQRPFSNCVICVICGPSPSPSASSAGPSRTALQGSTRR